MALHKNTHVQVEIIAGDMAIKDTVEPAEIVSSALRCGGKLPEKVRF